MATEARLRTELNEALRERDSARNERDAARLVIADQGDALRRAAEQIGYLDGERDQLDAAYRATLADLAEAHRQLAEVEPIAVAPARALHDEPDIERYG
ncbi:hypothetical protein I5G81_gp51 [Mycobacterium phage Shandong1]|uniref:Uncharacterized protein n=1 Tax=Mycobacterium phage Shandong1 TaxID=1983447 RepID=A0A1X9SHJ9_9CAUD|nr:hypothetical protein I5G81_gp51 [Mycobacterium phage Shandong1]ARQ95490.1 hypothetical protein [Mycobacterium phage Shandong1]